MFAGVPLIPFMLVAGLFLLFAVWMLYLLSGYVSLLLMIAYIPIVITMRQITKKDDQRLGQMMLRGRMRIRQRAGRPLWGAVSYAPIRYKRRMPA